MLNVTEPLVCATVVFHWSIASNIADSLAVLNSYAFCKVSHILRFGNSLAYVIAGWKNVCNLRGRISISSLSSLLSCF